MQSPKLETWKKFDRLYFYAKSQIKSTKYHNFKYTIEMLQSFRLEEISIIYTSMHILWLKFKKIEKNVEKQI